MSDSVAAIRVPQVSDAPSLEQEIAAARAEEAGGNPRNTVMAWASVRRAFPDRPEGYAGGGAAARAHRLFDEAEAVLAAGLDRFPDNLPIASELAWTARDLNNLKLALERWTYVRTRLPNEPAGWLWSAVTLIDLRRLDEAEAILAQAIVRFKDSCDIARNYALVATLKENWPTALSRWTALRAQFSQDPAGYWGATWVYRENGDPELADAVVVAGLARFPNNPDLVREAGYSAHKSAQWDKAAEWWQRLRSVVASDPVGYIFGAEAEAARGDFRRADEICIAGIERFPDDLMLAMRFAETAAREQDWIEACRRWEAALRRFPLDRGVQARLFEARMRVTESEPSAAETTGVSAVAPADPHMHDIMMAFESLGGALFGCEFGGVQRAFGAEPLGLLRWADSAPHHIAHALEERFAGVGDPENTELHVPEGRKAGQEYGTRDKRFHMAMHTFVDVTTVAPDVMFERACRRLQYLRRKLIEDLESSSKIFVYKITYDNLSEAELGRIYAAIRQFGTKTTLLYVRYSDPQHPDGTVEVTRPGLMVGYLDHFGTSRDDRELPLPVESWAKICKRAHALWVSGESEQPHSGDACLSFATASGSGSPAGAPVQWDTATIAALEAEASDASESPIYRHLRGIMARAGRGESALKLHQMLVSVVAENRSLYPDDPWFYDNFGLACMTAGAFDLASQLIKDRFGAAWRCDPVIEPTGNMFPVVRWDIQSRSNSRFIFAPSAFAAAHTIPTVLGWLRSMPLYDAYHRSPDFITGTVDLNIFDAGVAPGIAFCGNQADHFLVADMEFLYRKGHADVRTEIAARSVPWEKRQRVAFWRGGTTGHWDGRDWHTLPRIKLCELAAGSGGLIDAALSGIVQMPREVAAEIAASGLLKGRVAPAAFSDYRYLIDIDGNSNPWSGLLYRLFTGSTVLKVDSPLNYRMWYYSRLQPWVNYVPVASDMSDLLDKVAWLRANDDAAQAIGARGRELAVSLSYEREIARSCSTVTAAIRYTKYSRFEKQDPK